MEMTLNQYILNPALKTNAVLNAATREHMNLNLIILCLERMEK